MTMTVSDERLTDQIDDPSLAQTLELVPLEVVETKLISWATSMAAAKAQWLGWLAAYDRRKGFEQWGCRSAAQWLNWKCGMSLRTGHENVRVARCLETAPLVAEGFRAGRLSYSKVRALTRVVNEHNEADLVSLAENVTASQLSAICSGYWRSRADRDAAGAVEQRRLSCRDNDDGTSTITMVVLTDAAQAAMANVEAAADRIIDNAATEEQTRREVMKDRGGLAAIRSDAAIALLTGTAEEVPPATVEVVVSTETVPGDRSDRVVGDVWGHGLAESVLRRLACDAVVSLLTEDADGNPVGVSAATRTVSRRIRRALERRDRGSCQYPGCGATRRLHAHHIIHWANGGPTTLDNLVLVCHYHHQLIHEGGVIVDPKLRTFTAPNGQPARVGVSRGTVLELREWQHPRSSITTLEPVVPGPLDLHLTVQLLHHNERLHRNAAT